MSVPFGTPCIMPAHNIYCCFEELESPWKQLHADRIRTHTQVYCRRTPYDHDKQGMIKELQLLRSVDRTSRSDITLLVRFSSERLVHCILVLNCLFSIFISSRIWLIWGWILIFKWVADSYSTYYICVCDGAHTLSISFTKSVISCMASIFFLM